MTKNDCKGLTRQELPKEIVEVFMIHVEVVGDPNLIWDRLFRFLVMDNPSFPPEEHVAGLCTDFFHAIHSGVVERAKFNPNSIEAHLKAFNTWLPKYWQNKMSRRSFEAVASKEVEEPIYDMPSPSEPVTRQNWNMTKGLTITEIKNCVSIMTEIYGVSSKDMGPVAKVSGVNNFLARCKESVRRYEEAFSNRGKDSSWSS
jgi:hypothetical protein